MSVASSGEESALNDRGPFPFVAMVSKPNANPCRRAYWGGGTAVARVRVLTGSGDNPISEWQSASCRHRLEILQYRDECGRNDVGEVDQNTSKPALIYLTKMQEVFEASGGQLRLNQHLTLARFVSSGAGTGALVTDHEHQRNGSVVDRAQQASKSSASSLFEFSHQRLRSSVFFLWRWLGGEKVT